MSVAIIGAVVGIGATAYGVYSQQRAIDNANSAEPRPFEPIDIVKTAKLAQDADKLGFMLSDQDFKTRFPKLVMGREFNIADSALNLSGGTSKVVTEAMDKSGLSGDLGDTQFEKARALGKPILQMEQRDRGYFRQLLAENPHRAAGLTGSDVTRLAAQNTGAQNAFNSQIFGNKINQYNSQIAQGIQNQGAAVSGLASLAGLFSQNKTTQSGYLDPSYYNKSTTGKYG